MSSFIRKVIQWCKSKPLDHTKQLTANHWIQANWAGDVQGYELEDVILTRLAMMYHGESILEDSGVIHHLLSPMHKYIDFVRPVEQQQVNHQAFIENNDGTISLPLSDDSDILVFRPLNGLDYRKICGEFDYGTLISRHTGKDMKFLRKLPLGDWCGLMRICDFLVIKELSETTTLTQSL